VLFFFQAEDGIRDLYVTGVQTCALPIFAAVLKRADARDVLVGASSLASLPQGALVGTSSLRRQAQLAHARPDLRFTSIRGNVERSEERRVGKECRSWWATEH